MGYRKIECCEGRAQKMGWIANANLRNDMIALASRKTKDDKN